MNVIALHPILYKSKLYEIGEELPNNDPEMREAWLVAGTAKVEEIDTDSSYEEGYITSMVRDEENTVPMVREKQKKPGRVLK